MSQSTHSTIPKITRDEVMGLYREAIFSGMPLEDIQKKIQVVNSVVEEVNKPKKKARRLKKTVSLGLITFGSILVANAIWPIISYFLFVSPSLRRTELAAPIPDSLIVDKSSQFDPFAHVEASSRESVDPPIRPLIINETLDYSNLANWFSDPTKVTTEQSSTAKPFFVSIPSLNIEQAEVKVGGTDLNDSLIQYPGTAEPGQYGAPVIFGHSVLRQFYHPALTNPTRYKSIFSTIMTLSKGEEIYVEYEGLRYVYRVKEKHDVLPSDTFILEQRHRSRDLKLVTCIPEGTYLRRGVVVAELVSVEQSEHGVVR